MVGCLVHAVLLSTLLYAGMYFVRTASVIWYVHPGYIRGEGDRPNVPIGDSFNTCNMDHYKCTSLEYASLKGWSTLDLGNIIVAHEHAGALSLHPRIVS